jgi:hypothetical protein
MTICLIFRCTMECGSRGPAGFARDAFSFCCRLGRCSRTLCRCTALMKTPARIEATLKKLAAALDQLEAACERRCDADTERGNLDEEFAVLQDDRTRLGVELDAALARSKSLELANDEVARRLQKASATLRTMLSHVEFDER